MVNNGEYLHCLEQFSQVLEDNPYDQEALEGRISSCIQLKLFHRCLKDIEILSKLSPLNTKVHNLAGHIFEQVKAFERSISAYLNAYLHETQTETRLQILRKISQISSTLLDESQNEITDQNSDGFQILIALSKKLAECKIFQTCLDILITGLMAHCLDEISLRTFNHGLEIYSNKDYAKMEISKSLREDTIGGGVNLGKKTENEEHENTRTKHEEHGSTHTQHDNIVEQNARTEYTKLRHANIQLEHENFQSQRTHFLPEHANTKAEQDKPPTKHESTLNDCENTVEERAKNSDSLASQVTFQKNKSAESINYMLEQASECCYQLGKTETSLFFAEILSEHCQTFNDVTAMIKANSRLGFLHNECGNHESSIFYYTAVRSKCCQILEAKTTLENELEISMIDRESVLKLCELFKDMELCDEAQMLMKEYFSKIEVAGQDSLVDAYEILGDIELYQGRFKDAIKSYKMSLALCLQYHDQKRLVLAQSKLGMAYNVFENEKLAMEWFQMCLHTAKTTSDPFCFATAYGCIGEGLLSQNSPEKALPYFETQLDITTTIKEKKLRCHALYSLGKAYRDSRLFQHAEFFIKRALQECQEFKLPLESDVKRTLVEVLLTLNKVSEALKVLHDIRDDLETKFHRVGRLKILVQHRLLNKLNSCVNQILELLTEKDRLEEALELAEKTNCILLNQLLAYKAYIQESGLAGHNNANSTEFYQIINQSRKVVLYYRIVYNGFMVWILAPLRGIVHFHRFKLPAGSSFEEMVEELINGLLKCSDRLASYTCDHRKVAKNESLQVTKQLQKTGQNPNRLQHVDENRNAKTFEDSSENEALNEASDFLRKLSELFIFPIEEALTDFDMKNQDIVIVNDSFLNLVPFTDLQTSGGRSLQDMARSVQLLPCVSVLKVLENKKESSSPRGIKVIGNLNVKFSEALPGFRQEFLEQELNDVAVMLGTTPNMGPFGSKENFLREFNSSSLLHLAAYGSHNHGTLTLASITDSDPREISRDSWEITLENIVALRSAPEIIVLNSCYGCRNRFQELKMLNASLPLAMIVAGVRTVVMPTWSTPQKASLACLRQFYKYLSEDITVTNSLARAKAHVRENELFQEPVYWASFRVYGCDSVVSVAGLRRVMAEASFDEAQKLAVERFELLPQKEGREKCL